MNHFFQYLCLTTAIFSSHGFSSKRNFEQEGVGALDQSQATKNYFRADSYQKADPATTAAGIFLISSYESRPVVLVGNRTCEQGLCMLGGGADPEDLDLAKTASREVLKESIRFYGITPLELHRSFSHMAETSKGLFYRMYFSFVPFIDTQMLNNALQTAKGCSKEYTSFYWVPVSDLLNYDGSAITVDNEKIPLYGPFQKMLQEKPVQNILEYVRDNKQLLRFPSVLENGRGWLHTADREMAQMSDVETQRKSETQLAQSIVLKVQANLLIKQYGSLLENRLSRQDLFGFLKDDLSLKEECLKSLRKKASPENQQLLKPVEASLSLTIAEKELGKEWEPIGTIETLDEPALRRNISKFLTKNQTWEWAQREQERETPILFPENISDALLDVLVVHIKREIANPNYLPLYHGTQKSFEDFYYTMARLREILYTDPTSPHAGLRATDAYFGSDFPRTTEGLVHWLLESGNKLSTESQNFSTSLGIWVCKFGRCLSVFTGEMPSYSPQDLLSISQTGFAFLGAPPPDLLMASMTQQASSSLGGLVQILVPPTSSLGYTSDGGLKNKPISVGLKNQENFLPKTMAEEIRQGTTSFRDAHEIRFSPASWNTHNPTTSIYGARSPTPEQDRQISKALTQIGVDWLRSRKIFPRGGLAHQDSGLAQNPENDYGPDNLPPFFRLARKVWKDVQRGDYQMSVSEDALPLLLESGNIEGALQYCKIWPEAVANISSYTGEFKGIGEFFSRHHNKSGFWKDHSSEIKTCLLSHAKKYLTKLLKEKFESCVYLMVRSTYLPALENLLSYPEFQERFDEVKSLELRGVDPTQLPSSFWNSLRNIEMVTWKYNSIKVLDFSSCPILEVWVYNDGPDRRLKEVILSSDTKNLKILDGSLPKIRATGLKELFLHEGRTSDLDLSDLSDLETIGFCDPSVTTAKLPASVKKFRVYGTGSFPKLTGDVTHLNLFHCLGITQKILDLSELHSLKEISFGEKIAFHSILVDPQVIIKPSDFNRFRKAPAACAIASTIKTPDMNDRAGKWWLVKLSRLWSVGKPSCLGFEKDS